MANPAGFPFGPNPSAPALSGLYEPLLGQPASSPQAGQPWAIFRAAAMATVVFAAFTANLPADIYPTTKHNLVATRNATAIIQGTAPVRGASQVVLYEANDGFPRQPDRSWPVNLIARAPAVLPQPWVAYTRPALPRLEQEDYRAQRAYPFPWGAVAPATAQTQPWWLWRQQARWDFDLPWVVTRGPSLFAFYQQAITQGTTFSRGPTYYVLHEANSGFPRQPDRSWPSLLLTRIAPRGAAGRDRLRPIWHRPEADAEVAGRAEHPFLAGISRHPPPDAAQGGIPVRRDYHADGVRRYA